MDDQDFERNLGAKEKANMTVRFANHKAEGVPRRVQRDCFGEISEGVCLPQQPVFSKYGLESIQKTKESRE